MADMTKLQKTASAAKKATTVLYVLLMVVAVLKSLQIVIYLMPFIPLSMLDVGFFQYELAVPMPKELPLGLLCKVIYWVGAIGAGWLGLKFGREALDALQTDNCFSDKVIIPMQKLGGLLMGYGAVSPLFLILRQVFYRSGLNSNGYFRIGGKMLSLEWVPFQNAESWLLLGLLLVVIGAFFRRGAVLQQEDDELL